MKASAKKSLANITANTANMIKRCYNRTYVNIRDKDKTLNLFARSEPKRNLNPNLNNLIIGLCH